jgi:hypothetical protein
MSRQLFAPPRKLKTWCVYAVLLIVPGSLVIVAALWLMRLVRDQFVAVAKQT